MLKTITTHSEITTNGALPAGAAFGLVPWTRRGGDRCAADLAASRAARAEPSGKYARFSRADVDALAEARNPAQGDAGGAGGIPSDIPP